MYESARWNQGLLLVNENVIIFSLNKTQKWPVWQFTVLWLLPWFFCSCLFVLMFYSRDKRRSWNEGLLQGRKWKEDERKDRGERAGLGERTPPDCGRLGEKQPIRPVTLTAPRFVALAMPWGTFCGRISAVEVVCPKRSCVYSSPVTARRSRKYTC